MGKLLGLSVLAVCLAAALGCNDRKDARTCATWKSRGHCQKSSSMKYWCPYTCGFCGTPVTQFPPVTSNPGGNDQCGISPVQQSRVVNGFTSKEGAWPWIASLQMRGRHFCGGTLITPTWVLTAAHCVERQAGMSIKMGAHNHGNREASAQNIAIKRIIRHPGYSRNTLKADFALIELQKPATLNARVRLACLPKSAQYPKPGSTCYIQGWGSTRHPGGVATILQQAKMPIVDSSKCKHQREVVCAGFGTTTDPNACRGDSGGPFVCRQSDGSWVLEGVASYVVEYCKYYTGFSPVNQYLPWIRSYIGN